MPRASTSEQQRGLLPSRPRRRPDLGPTAEFNKLRESTYNRLAVAGNGKATDAAEAVVVKLTRLLEDRDERIAELEAELARLGGTPLVTKRGDREGGVRRAALERGADEAEYRKHLAHVASASADPERRLRAAALRDLEVFSE